MMQAHPRQPLQNDDQMWAAMDAVRHYLQELGDQVAHLRHERNQLEQFVEMLAQEGGADMVVTDDEVIMAAQRLLREIRHKRWGGPVPPEKRREMMEDDALGEEAAQRIREAVVHYGGERTVEQQLQHTPRVDWKIAEPPEQADCLACGDLTWVPVPGVEMVRCPACQEGDDA